MKVAGAQAAGFADGGTAAHAGNVAKAIDGARNSGQGSQAGLHGSGQNNGVGGNDGRGQSGSNGGDGSIFRNNGYGFGYGWSWFGNGFGNGRSTLPFRNFSDLLPQMPAESFFRVGGNDVGSYTGNGQAQGVANGFAPGSDFGQVGGNGNGLGIGVGNGSGQGIGDGAVTGVGNGGNFGIGQGDGTGYGHADNFSFGNESGSGVSGGPDLARAAASYTGGAQFADALQYGQGNADGYQGASLLSSFANSAFRDGAAAAQFTAQALADQRDFWQGGFNSFYGHGNDLMGLKYISELGGLLRQIRNQGLGPAEIISIIVERQEVRALSAQMQAGVAHLGDAEPAAATGTWLRDAPFGLAGVPGQVAEKLAGQQFASFAEFGRSFWQSVARTPELATLFSEANLARMRQGLAPLAPEADSLADLRTYVLQHKASVAQGGEVYDLSNIVVASPFVNQVIADLRYNYAIMNIMYNQFTKDPERRRRKRGSKRRGDRDEFVFGRWLRKKWQFFRRRRRWRGAELRYAKSWSGRMAGQLLEAVPI